MSLSSNEIADIIMKNYNPKGYSPMTTSFQGCGLHEADVLGITPANYIVEFEIKRSKADFKADFKKEQKHTWLAEGNGCTIYKRWVKGRKTDEDRIYFNIPNRFYYVCETDLIKIDEVPTYAGLIYINSQNKCEVIKKAPLLHKQKATDDLILSMAKNLTAKLIYGSSYMNWKRKELLN